MKIYIKDGNGSVHLLLDDTHTLCGKLVHASTGDNQSERWEPPCDVGLITCANCIEERDRWLYGG